MTGGHGGRTAIAARGLCKAYGGQAVLDGVDLDVAAGSVFALLGANGAGKTTVVRILTTLVRADAGEARVGGRDVVRDADAVRAVIGVTGQFSAVDGLLSGEENLLLMAALDRVPRRARRARAAELLERFDLADAARKPAAAYSGGMRRRLDLAMTLVARPRVVFLDEPTTGLDPRSRRTMWEIVRGLVADDGVTVFLTTQYLEEADRLADRVAVLHGGTLVAQGSPADLKRRVGGGRVTVRCADPDGYRRAARLLDVRARDDAARTLDVAGEGDPRSLRALLDRLDGAAVAVDGIDVHGPGLEDVFFALTDRPAAAREVVR